MKKIAVILSTYNGERFLLEQLDSLNRQRDVELTLYVRDDGSKDATHQLLEEYVSSFEKVLYFEANLGFEKSFRAAVLKVPLGDYDYFAFCDQDDIWDDDKLIKAIQTIEEYSEQEPFLYASNQRIVDEAGKWIRDEAEKTSGITKASSLLALNQRGCVMVWNRPLQRHLQASYQLMEDTGFTPAHDTWLTVLAYATGQVYLDSRITMSYRVSTHNTAGSYVGLFGRAHYVLTKIKTVITKRQFEKTTIAKILQQYLAQQGIASAYVQHFLEAPKSLWSSLQFFKNHPEYFSGMSYKWQLFSKLLILLRRI